MSASYFPQLLPMPPLKSWAKLDHRGWSGVDQLFLVMPQKSWTKLDRGGDSTNQMFLFVSQIPLMSDQIWTVVETNLTQFGRIGEVWDAYITLNTLVSRRASSKPFSIICKFSSELDAEFQISILCVLVNHLFAQNSMCFHSFHAYSSSSWYITAKKQKHRFPFYLA